MNCFRWPRLRPRVRSVNYATLGWVTLREAVFRLTCNDAEPRSHAELRSRLANMSNPEVAKLGGYVLTHWPSRRWRP